MSDLDVLLAKLQNIEDKLSNIPPATATIPPEIIDTTEVCKRFNITEPTLRTWRRKKKIPSITIGNVIRFNWPEVVKSLETKSQGK
jgi:excisionase family DNA binding protein